MNEVRDEFEQDMDKKKEILLSCQNSKNLNSCYNCDEIFNCQTRKNYVDQSITVCLRVKPKADLTFKGKKCVILQHQFIM